MDPEATPGANLCATRQTNLGPSQPESNDAPRRRSRASKDPAAINELPPPGTRWVIRRKAQLVAAVQAGVLTLDEVFQRYSVSAEEFESWRSALQRHGVYGLRTTRTQIYRGDKSKVADKA